MVTSLWHDNCTNSRLLWQAVSFRDQDLLSRNYDVMALCVTPLHGDVTVASQLHQITLKWSLISCICYRWVTSWNLTSSPSRAHPCVTCWNTTCTKTWIGTTPHPILAMLLRESPSPPSTLRMERLRITWKWFWGHRRAGQRFQVRDIFAAVGQSADSLKTWLLCVCNSSHFLEFSSLYNIVIIIIIVITVDPR